MKITLDTTCFNLKENKNLDFIFELADKNEINIFWADAFLADVLLENKEISDLPKNQQEAAKKRLEKAKSFPQIKSWITFKYPYNVFPLRFGDKEIQKKFSDILFPHRKDINGKYDEVDVRHIVAHYFEKNDVFITENIKDYITGNKRETLQHEFGVVVKTPKEFVSEWEKK